ncbi:unnamed protein product [Protopolystoma xenopodis]|uniref:Uncharacterized protein n=1 Tax=Protopolystoma xenopodis TaxID=117903 RepID=A0A3S5B2C5_9PLAT|nr:unnamed protein product [Protopolystoma xenopodis]
MGGSPFDGIRSQVMYFLRFQATLDFPPRLQTRTKNEFDANQFDVPTWLDGTISGSSSHGLMAAPWRNMAVAKAGDSTSIEQAFLRCRCCWC